MPRAFRTVLLVLLLGAVTAVGGAAQSGTLVGKVTQGGDNRPLPGAVVTVLISAGVGTATTRAGAGGNYRLTGLTAGTYSVQVSNVGNVARTMPAIITAGGTTRVDAALDEKPLQLEEVTVSIVSRAPEKVTDAPAAAFAISRAEIAERPALTVVDHLKSIPGVDISTGGLVQANVVARGFNNAFSGALLTLIDYRYAAVPSLRVNVATFFPTTNEDIERIEFVLGPGAALYGPNSANGVLNIITRSPFTSVGTTLSLEAGARAGSRYGPASAPLSDNGAGVWRLTARHAMRLGNRVAFKVSGNYLKGTEWRMRDPAEPADLNTSKPELTGLCNPNTGCRDFNLEQYGAEARVDLRPGANSEIIVTYGLTNSKRFIEYTGIGAGQARDWKYSAAQLRFRSKRLFVQAFGNFSNSGKTFLLPSGIPIQDSSRVLSTQFQHGLALGKRETVVYGADYIFTDARTGGTINGSNEADDDIKEIGGYVHSVTHLTSQLDFVGALRLDKNSRLRSAVWSPRAALLYKPTENSAFRVTFNRAFSTPGNNDLFLDIVALHIPLYDIRALGVPSTGFQFRSSATCAPGIDHLCMRTPFNPGAGALPAHAATLWDAAVTVISPSIPGSLATLMHSAPPSSTQVGTQLRLLSRGTGTWADIVPAQVRDITPLEPTISHQLELGYKALIKNRFQISVDWWHERKQNFIGPLIIESPTVFLDRNMTIAYLTTLFSNAGIPNAQATAIQVGTAMAGLSNGTVTAGTTGVPLATVVPTNSRLTERPDLFLTTRNFGKVTLWGADLALDMVFGSHFSLAGGYSYVNKDFFPRGDLGNAPSDIALNGSKSKGSITTAWRDDARGWSAEARFRAVKGFPVSSGFYVSPPDPNHPGGLLPLDSYGVFDLQGTWHPPFGARNMLVSVNLQNVANKHYVTFVGVPTLGRLFLTKLTYTF